MAVAHACLGCTSMLAKDYIYSGQLKHPAIIWDRRVGCTFHGLPRVMFHVQTLMHRDGAQHPEVMLDTPAAESGSAAGGKLVADEGRQEGAVTWRSVRGMGGGPRESHRDMVVVLKAPNSFAFRCIG
jgi:hypothetical protein